MVRQLCTLQRVQSRAKVMMPCAQYEALEAPCQARCEWGQVSNKDTDLVNDDNVEEEQEDLNGPPELSTVEARVCQVTIVMFQSVLLFSKGAAQALYDNQMIMTLDVHQELNNDTIKDIAHAIRNPRGEAQGFQISELFVSRLKLFAF
jgi:hypothetical protein